MSDERFITEFEGAEEDFGSKDVARTYDLKGVEVQCLDGSHNPDGIVIDHDTVWEGSMTVPLVSSPVCHPKTTDIIGCANVYFEGHYMKADLFINYDTPHRLALEVEGKLYPSICGVLLEEETKDKRFVKRARLTAIALTSGKNTDDRIGHLTGTVFDSRGQR